MAHEVQQTLNMIFRFLHIDLKEHELDDWNTLVTSGAVTRALSNMTVPAISFTAATAIYRIKVAYHVASLLGAGAQQLLQWRGVVLLVHANLKPIADQGVAILDSQHQHRISGQGPWQGPGMVQPGAITTFFPLGPNTIANLPPNARRSVRASLNRTTAMSRTTIIRRHRRQQNRNQSNNIPKARPEPWPEIHIPLMFAPWGPGAFARPSKFAGCKLCAINANGQAIHHPNEPRLNTPGVPNRYIWNNLTDIFLNVIGVECLTSHRNMDDTTIIYISRRYEFFHDAAARNTLELYQLYVNAELPLRECAGYSNGRCANPRIVPAAPGTDINNALPVTEFYRRNTNQTGLDSKCQCCAWVLSRASKVAITQTATSGPNGRSANLTDYSDLNGRIEYCQTCGKFEAVLLYSPAMRGGQPNANGLITGQEIGIEPRPLRLAWDHTESLWTYTLRGLECCTCNIEGGALENMARPGHAGVSAHQQHNNMNRARNFLR